jgi:hypothetical protein
MLDDSEISGYREAVHPAFSQAFDVVSVASEGADHVDRPQFGGHETS